MKIQCRVIACFVLTLVLALVEGAEAQQIVECGPLSPSSGACSVTAGDESLLVEGTILQEERVLRGGQLLVGGDGVIACVACDCSAAATATRIVCPEGVVAPGFINLHEHATYSTSPPVDHGSERFDHRHDWRLGLNGHTEFDIPSDSSAAALAWVELRHLLAGTTSTVDSAGVATAAGFQRNLDDPSRLEGLSEPALDSSTFPLGDSDGTLLPSGCAYPGFDGPVAGRLYVPHVAQGVDAAARNELICLLDAAEPGGHDALFGAAVGGGIALRADDAARLRSRGASVVWSPRHDVSLYGMTTPVTLLAQEGVNVALATSWRPTGSMSLDRELQCALDLNETYFDNYFSARDLLGMVTWSAARAAGLEHVLGHLAPGYWADLVIFDGSPLTDYDAAIQGHPADVALVLRGGLPLFGDGGVLVALGAGDGLCEIVGGADCLSGKRVCVSRESGGLLSWAGLGASFGNPYSCTPPAGEPTCVPSRDEGDGIVYDGTTTASDGDGDGVADGVDNCPAIFNPPRPVDGFVQADEDGDGIGDACDDAAATLLFEATFENGDSCTFSSTVGAAEVCDGADNDCDGMIDEGVALNACGGCSVLPAEPGETCNVCGQYACDGTDALTCSASCNLAAFGPEPSFVREGDVGVTTIPEPVVVTLESAPSSDTFVPIDPSAAAVAVVGGGVTVLAGNTSAEVLLDGLSQAATVTLTASLDGVSLEVDVRVVGALEQPALDTLTPLVSSVPPFATTSLTVSLDIPASTGGSSVTLMSAPGTAGSVPPSVVVSQDELSASFDFTAGGTPGTETVTATLALGGSADATVDVIEGALVINEVDYDQPGPDTVEFVEIYNGTSAPVDLSSLALVLVNGSSGDEYDRFSLASAGALASGGYLVVGSAALLATVPLGTATIDFGNASIQNGSPDGLALVDEGVGEVLDALSYEGEITGATINGIGTVDLVEGTATAAVDAGDGSLIRHPNGVDSDDAASDWAFTTTTTPGVANVP
jgi:cytosine/adenosine deaminase-related metal-dependent hydrolase